MFHDTSYSNELLSELLKVETFLSLKHDAEKKVFEMLNKDKETEISGPGLILIPVLKLDASKIFIISWRLFSTNLESEEPVFSNIQYNLTCHFFESYEPVALDAGGLEITALPNLAGYNYYLCLPQEVEGLKKEVLKPFEQAFTIKA